MAASDYQYWLGKETADLKIVGKRGIARKDGYEKASGKAEFTGEVKPPGMLYARMLTCPYAHGKIKSMDTSEAEKLPGVRAVLRYDDPIVPKRLWSPWDADLKKSLMSPFWGAPFYILGDEGWHYNTIMGVAIAADDPDIAEEALELVKVEWEEKEFVVDIAKAIEPNAPLAIDFIDYSKWDPQKLWEPGILFYNPLVYHLPGDGKPSNIRATSIFTPPEADMSKGFAEAEKTLEFSFRRTEVSAWSPEVTAFTAKWHEDDTLEGWAGGEALIEGLYPYLLGITTAPKRFHAGTPIMQVHYPYVGGQFGGWEMAYSSHYSVFCVAALLSKKADGRPVKAALERRNETTTSEMDEGLYNIKVGFKKDGTITAVEMKNYFSQTADPGMGTMDLLGTGHLREDTTIANIWGQAAAVALNKGAFCASRCEQQVSAKGMTAVINRVAADLGMDPADVMKKNEGYRGHDMAWVSQFKQDNKMPDVDSLAMVIEKGHEAMDWANKWHEPGTKKLANGKMHGVGALYGHEFSNGGGPLPIYNSAYKCHVAFDGGKVVLVGHRKDCGLDGRTNYSRVVAEIIGMNYEDVQYDRQYEREPSEPRTNLNGGGGSKLFTLSAWFFASAARLLKKRMLETAATFLKVTPEELDIVDSNVFFKSDPTKVTPLKSIAALDGLLARNHECTTKQMYTDLGIPSYPTEDAFIARLGNYVEIEVDPETGSIDIIKVVAVNDVGQAISPETVEGQMYGALVMGNSNATMEEVVYDPPTGVVLNPTCIDYKVATMLDTPAVDCVMLQNRMGYSLFGAAGVGEDNTTWGSALMPYAVYNALGVWVNEYPVTPDRILKALGKG
jgi:xanthine dehydrogenase molybdenum-binding subunit